MTPLRRSPRLAAALGALLLLGGCGGPDADGGIERRVPRQQRGGGAEPVPAAVALAYWPGTAADELALYPAPGAVATVARAAEIPRVAFAAPSGAAAGAANEAVRLEILASAVQPAIFSHAAPPGHEFVVLDTRWRNIHPRRLMEKAELEGRADRTMGLGNFASGGGSGGGAKEMVEADVAYLVPSLLDHLYVVADGVAMPLHAATADLPGGTPPQGPLALPRLGDERSARLAFLAPAGAKDVALHFFDYEYGHVLLPVRGSASRARGDGGPPRGALARASTDQLELAALGLELRASYGGRPAPAGQRYAVVRLSGRSASASGSVMNIVQVDPVKYLWLEGDGGYLYGAAGGSVNAAGLLRFTPEIHQQQEAAFLVPEVAERFRLGMRVENEVVRLELTRRRPEPLPRARRTHRDGGTMEVLLLGSRRSGDHLVLDLAVRPTGDRQGIEIATNQQFRLLTAGGELGPDMEATWTLPHAPPHPLVVPPGTPLRFELAFPARGAATALRVRGFESDGRLEL